MLTIKTIPMLMCIVSKIDLKPTIERLRTVDIFDTAETANSAEKQLDREKIGVLGAEILAELLPQLCKIADDVVPLIAAYKGISNTEAEKLDAAEVINELIYDEGIRSFFKRALLRKTEQEH